ncbi:MAG: hypothetical protein ACI88C_000004 [Acidimicrobiales bacterium]|jgi:hypothetical protein
MSDYLKSHIECELRAYQPLCIASIVSKVAAQAVASRASIEDEVQRLIDTGSIVRWDDPKQDAWEWA